MTCSSCATASAARKKNGQYDNLTYVKLTDGFEVAEEDKVVSIGVRKGFELTEKMNEVLTNTLTTQLRATLMEQAIAKAPQE